MATVNLTLDQEYRIDGTLYHTGNQAVDIDHAALLGLLTMPADPPAPDPLVPADPNTVVGSHRAYNGSVIVRGNGTSYRTDLAGVANVWLNGVQYGVAKIHSDTAFELDAAYGADEAVTVRTAAAPSGQAYTNDSPINAKAADFLTAGDPVRLRGVGGVLEAVELGDPWYQKPYVPQPGFQYVGLGIDANTFELIQLDADGGYVAAIYHSNSNAGVVNLKILEIDGDINAVARVSNETTVLPDVVDNQPHFKATPILIGFDVAICLAYRDGTTGNKMVKIIKVDSVDWGTGAVTLTEGTPAQVTAGAGSFDKPVMIGWGKFVDSVAGEARTGIVAMPRGGSTLEIQLGSIDPADLSVAFGAVLGTGAFSEALTQVQGACVMKLGIDAEKVMLYGLTSNGWGYRTLTIAGRDLSDDDNHVLRDLSHEFGRCAIVRIRYNDTSQCFGMHTEEGVYLFALEADGSITEYLYQAGVSGDANWCDGRGSYHGIFAQDAFILMPGAYTAGTSGHIFLATLNDNYLDIMPGPIVYTGDGDDATSVFMGSGYYATCLLIGVTSQIEAGILVYQVVPNLMYAFEGLALGDATPGDDVEVAPVGARASVAPLGETLVPGRKYWLHEEGGGLAEAPFASHPQPLATALTDEVVMVGQ